MSFERFQDEGYKNWIKTTMGLHYLKTFLADFLENETETFHLSLRQKIGDALCSKTCHFKGNPRHNLVPNVCGVCKPWRDEILENHTNKKGQVYWQNCTPSLWPKEKWEVAKVYMSKGNKDHKTKDQFDISAFLNLMSSCKHFKFVNNNKILPVINVRNQVMHSADFKVTTEDVQTFLGRIKNLGSALEECAPDLKALANELDQLQNTDFNLVLSCAKARGQIELHGGASMKVMKAEEFLNMELQIMKNKMESLAHLAESKEDSLTLEDLQGVRSFLEGNRDLKERLEPQMQRLQEVQEQQGQQITCLTGRVEDLEKKTVTADQEFSVEVKVYKNHLFEVARKHGWPAPVFSEIREATGFKGQVEVNGKTYQGLQVSRAKVTAHQEVAKLALNHLTKEIAETVEVEQSVNDEETGELSISHTDQSASGSQAGSAFFGSVTVELDNIVKADDGCSPDSQAVESAYKKLACVFGMESSQSALSYKEAVLQYCQRRDVSPPEEIAQSDRFSLRLQGPITFHDSDGSVKKKQAQQQAAKAALQALSGVLGKREVQKENYVGALKELLDSCKLKKASYDVTQRPAGTTDDREAMEEMQPAPLTQTLQPSDSPVPCTSATHNPVTMETPATASRSEERSNSQGGEWLGCVKVAVFKELPPQEASSQERAVQAAYSSLFHTLSLDPPSTPGGERQCVVEFFTRANSLPPAEDCVMTSNGLHRCTLKVHGKLTFHSPEKASRKQLAEQGAAREALRYLEKLLGGNTTHGKNYKGRLQELLAKHGGGGFPEYSIADTQNTGTAQCMTKNIVDKAPSTVGKGASAVGPTLPADKPSISRLVPKEAAPEDANAPPTKKFAGMCGDVPTEVAAMRRVLEPLDLWPDRVLCEQVDVEQRSEWTLCVSLARFTFQNPKSFSSKQRALRSSYHALGLAGDIFQTDTEEIQATAKVKQFFSQRSFPPPKENVDQEREQEFTCSLTDITCSFTYSAEGSSKTEACLRACQKAISCLALLIGCLPTLHCKAEEAELKLKSLLEQAGLELSSSALTKTQHRCSARFKLSGCCMETKGQGRKKESRARLAQRLLGVLGEKVVSKDLSVKDANEWFCKRRLDRPVFEETDDKFGTRLTFSAPLQLSYTDWQSSNENAEKRLVEELRGRVRYLCEESIELPITVE